MNSERPKCRKGLTIKWSKIGPLLITPTLLISGCGIVSPQPTPTPIPLPDSTSPTSRLNQNIATVELGDIVTMVTYPGKIAISEEEDLFFRRGGRVQTVAVEDGDILQKDTLIAELDTDIINIDLESASLAVDIANEQLAKAEENLLFDRRRAELSLEIAKLALESFEARYESNTEQIVSSGYRIEEGLKIQERQVEQAEISLARIDEEVNPVLKLNLERAELNLKRVRQSLLDSKIRAPFDGEIRFITLPDDDRQVAASAYQAVARMIKPDSLNIELNLSRNQLEPLAEGDPVDIRTINRPDEVIEGKIDSLPRPFGTGIGTLTSISVNSDADKKRLIEGSTVDVNIQLENKESVLRIPVTALRGVPGDHYVYISDTSGREETVTVEVGVQNNVHVEIVSGLVEGQKILDQ